MKVFSKTFIAGTLALLVGFGSVFGAKGIMSAMNSKNDEEETVTNTDTKVSHQRMLLDNFLKMGSFNVNGGIKFTLEDSTAINLGLDFTGDISDINNIKLKGNADLYLNGIEVSTDIQYYKDANSENPNDQGTIYFGYKQNKFYLETEHVLDFIDMLPTEYGIELNMPEELQNLDLNTISDKIDGMEEKQSTNGDIYFILNLSKDVDLYVKSDADYNIKGIRTDDIVYKGNTIHLDIALEKADSVTFEVPNKAQYQNFKPIFNVFKSFYNLLKKKQNLVNISASIAKLDEEQNYKQLVDATIGLGYDVTNKSFQIDADIHENSRHHKVGMLFEDRTAYLDIRKTKLSIKFDSVGDVIGYIIDQLDFNMTEKLMSSASEILSSDQFKDIRNGLSNLVGTINISETSLSIDLDTDAIGLGMGIITPTITFQGGELKNISLHGLKIKGLKIDLDLSIGNYVHKSIQKDQYVAFEPALTIIEAVMPLIKQTQFRIEFDASVKSTDTSVKDITIDGGLQFDVSDNGFGYGKAVIVDRDSYRHEIKADMKNKDEFLFSYNDTLNGKFSSRTLKEIYGLITDIINNPDDHFIELFGELIEALKNTPIGKALDGDYGALLETDLINSLSITDTALKVNLSLGIIGMDDKSCDFEIDYHRDNENDKGYLDGIKLTNLEIGGNIIEFNAYLKDFDPSKESERLDAYEQYLDFSDIKVLLQLGINTSKFNYFHFSATVKFSLTLIVDIERELDVDIQIRNNKGKVQVAAEFTNIPIIDLKLISFNSNEGYIETKQRTASLYFDEDIIYTKRVDDVRKAFSTKVYRITSGAAYTTDYFLDNVLEIILRDIIGVRSNWIESIVGDSTTESESSQIEYEKILSDFKYDANNGKFTFKIDLYALTHTSVLQTLDLTVYEDKQTEQLTGIDVNLTIHVLINIKLSMKLRTVSKQENLTDANALTALNQWAASRAGARQNSFDEISNVLR